MEARPLPQDSQEHSHLEDNEVSLVNQDTIHHGDIVTKNAALAGDVINNSNVMDNTAADFSSQLLIPPQHQHDRPAPDRHVQP